MNAVGDNAEEDAGVGAHEENPYQPPTTNDLRTAEPFNFPLGTLAMLVVVVLFLVAALWGFVTNLIFLIMERLHYFS